MRISVENAKKQKSFFREINQGRVIKSSKVESSLRSEFPNCDYFLFPKPLRGQDYTLCKKLNSQNAKGIFRFSFYLHMIRISYHKIEKK